VGVALASASGQSSVAALGLLESMVAPALPVLQHDLHASEGGTAWVVTALLLSIGAGAGTVLAGVIIDHLSYHWLFWLPLIAVVRSGPAGGLGQVACRRRRIQAPSPQPFAVGVQ
jgi:MFS family permease